MIFLHSDLTATGRPEFGRHDHIRSRARKRGQQMIIDLDSWEAGYGDGLRGRPSQCTPGLDRFSYSSGYVQARASRAGTQEATRLRYVRSSIQRAPQRHGGSSRLIYLSRAEASAYSITSSARASSVGGTSRPIVLAVCRLMTNSNLVGSWTGISAGFSPLRMRPT